MILQQRKETENMGDLHQKLSELRRCFDDGLLSQEQYDLALRVVIENWGSELFTFIM